jgi:hypothetical protein
MAASARSGGNPAAGSRIEQLVARLHFMTHCSIK